MPPQRRSQGLASPHSATPQRSSRNRLLTIHAIEGDLSLSRRHRERDDSFFEITADGAPDEGEAERSADPDAGEEYKIV